MLYEALLVVMVWKIHLKQTQQDFRGRILFSERTTQSEVLLNWCLNWELIRISDMTIIKKKKKLIQTSIEFYTLFQRIEANHHMFKIHLISFMRAKAYF